MDAEHTPERYEDAAKFYSESPDGQYDVDAAHALRCHFDLLKALEELEEAARKGPCGEWDRNSIDVERRNARSALAKAKAQS
jgi:hypothetical protein